MGFAQRLKEAMDSTHTTMYRLSKILGVHPTTIKNWLDGKSEPSVSQLQKIANALEMSLPELLGVEQQVKSITDNKKMLSLIANEFDMPVEMVEHILWGNEGIEAIQKMLKVRSALTHNQKSKDIKSDLDIAFEKLNDKGQQVAVERVEELTKIPDYQKDTNV